jgi:hypothetical protein
MLGELVAGRARNSSNQRPENCNGHARGLARPGPASSRLTAVARVRRILDPLAARDGEYDQSETVTASTALRWAARQPGGQRPHRPSRTALGRDRALSDASSAARPGIDSPIDRRAPRRRRAPRGGGSAWRAGRRRDRRRRSAAATAGPCPACIWVVRAAVRRRCRAEPLAARRSGAGAGRARPGAGALVVAPPGRAARGRRPPAGGRRGDELACGQRQCGSPDRIGRRRPAARRVIVGSPTPARAG